MLKTSWPAMLLVTVSLLSGCAAVPGKSASSPNHGDLQRALRSYLATQGNVCLGKFEWPIEVSEREFRRGARDAVQMPVLEKLGLVTSTDASAQRVHEDGEPETVAVKRYELTDAGKKFYVAKDVTTEGPGGADIEHHKDFCGAKLSLDTIVAWSKDGDPTGTGQVTLTYTFHVQPAEWATHEEALRVFPMLDRVIKGAGTMRLEQRMSLTPAGWVAVAPTS